MDIIRRARIPLTPWLYGYVHPLPVMVPEFNAPKIPSGISRHYILRMLVGCPKHPIAIPPELSWLRKAVHDCHEHHNRHFIRHPFIYLTVRHGLCNSTTDDTWHVDGFSMRTPHLPEQNYIWQDGKYPTEFLNERIKLPLDFDPLRHNLHNYFQKHASGLGKVTTFGQSWTLLDPYAIHRRPVSAFGRWRTMVRISFVPILIKDDTNTPNPLIPMPKFNNVDIRKQLVNYGDSR